LKKGRHSSPSMLNYRIREGLLIVFAAIALFFMVALLTYHNADPAWSHAGSTLLVANAAGKAGAWLADVFLYIFGYCAYLFPAMLIYSAWLGLRHADQPIMQGAVVLRSIGFMLILIGGCGLLSLNLPGIYPHLPYSSGGILGDLCSQGLVIPLNFIGAVLVLLAMLLCGVTLFSGLSWVTVMDYTGYFAVRILLGLAKLSFAIRDRVLQFFAGSEEEQLDEDDEDDDHEEIAEDEAEEAEEVLPKRKRKVKALEKRIEPKLSTNQSIITETPSKLRPQKISRRVILKGDEPAPEGDLPPLTLLDMPEETITQSYSNATLEAMSREVEMRLQDFGIEVQVVAVHPGPVITRFELQLAPGIKVSKITGLAKDLARSLSTISVRVVEVIPGKSVVGLELPNEYREIVRLREVLGSTQYLQSRSPLSLALGKDIAGHPVIVDLGKMPHLLVAGTTGSGKSVGLNAMLLSILYKATPQEVRMIMIDPKMLELSIYEGIPHLLTPVVTDMKEAASALRWCVAEMDKRYRVMAALGVRNLAGYNSKVSEAIQQGKPLLDPLWQSQMGVEPEPLEHLPYVVVVVDEFADMIMVVGKKVEELIARIAQKARAAGIHLILATQRPSVDVITGLIKANVPTRIAFQVSSRIDSRTILDQQGAEQLLGHGDMLYLAPGTGVPVRVHGAFVDDQEVHRVVHDWRLRGSPNYINEITSYGAEGGMGEIDGESSEANAESDPLYDQAVQIVIQTRRASISNVQRRLKIGYNRAARMIEQMERAGLVSSMASNGSREVLIPVE
jgi:DNA segregation ATPase FtsK/SpoIIIE, S-DNA-T family